MTIAGRAVEALQADLQIQPESQTAQPQTTPISQAQAAFHLMQDPGAEPERQTAPPASPASGNIPLAALPDADLLRLAQFQQIAIASGSSRESIIAALNAHQIFEVLPSPPQPPVA